MCMRTHPIKYLSFSARAQNLREDLEKRSGIYSYWPSPLRPLLRPVAQILNWLGSPSFKSVRTRPGDLLRASPSSAKLFSFS